MMPNPELLEDIVVEGVIIAELLKVINQRIEVLYDREHTIGRAYFMGLSSSSSIKELGKVFSNKIIPPLAEYFFEDWEKIRMILGDDQKGKQHPFILEESFENKDLFLGKKPDFEDNQRSYKRNGDAALLCPESYIGIYEKLKNQPKTKADAKA